MSRDRGRSINLEDRILWSRVAESVKPLSGRSVPVAPSEPPKVAKDEAAGTSTTRHRRTEEAAKARQTAAPPGGIDRPTRRKLAKGRLPIEGKVDLHGLTQREAHGLLLSFLSRARTAGRRHVLVVTGKGSSPGSEGVLRRAVPQWLATPVFRGLVAGFEDASRGHGGSGALYVRLRGPRSGEE